LIKLFLCILFEKYIYILALDAAQPYAKAEGCVHDNPPGADKLRKGWPFRVGTWNVDSLTGRSGELVEALSERRMWHVSKKLGGEVLGVGSLVL